MNIIIVSRRYNRSGSTDIQINRTINALSEYGQSNVILVTEGKGYSNYSTEHLEIINLQIRGKGLEFLNRVLDRAICNPICLRKNQFILEGMQVTRRLIREKHVDLLITISTPFDAHVIGMGIKEEFKYLKWVAMFTDLWPAYILPKPYKRMKLLYKREVNLMKQTVSSCDGIITQSEYAGAAIKSQFKTKGQIAVIPHSIRLRESGPFDKLKGYIVHSGSIQKERLRRDLVEAIAEVAKENQTFKGLIHIGAYSSRLVAMIRKYKCKNIYLLGRLPEELAQQIQSMFEVGIIIEAPMSEPNPFVPGKITDCINLNKKVIAITPQESFISDFAKEVGGINCCIYEKESIKKCIVNTLKSSENIDTETAKIFHPSRISRQYEGFFHEICNGR